MLRNTAHLVGQYMIWIRCRLFRGNGLAIWMSPCLLKPRRWGRIGSARGGGALAAAPAVDTSVVKEHSQLWNPAMEPQVEAPQSSEVEGVDGAISAWLADECNRLLGQALSLDAEKMHADLVCERKLREMAARKQVGVYTQRNACHVSKKIAQTRRVFTWKMVGGKTCVMARLAATGFQARDLQEGAADTSGCVRIRSSHVQVTSLGTIKKWELWSLDFKNASLQADGFDREVFFFRAGLVAPALSGSSLEIEGAGVRIR